MSLRRTWAIIRVLAAGVAAFASAARPTLAQESVSRPFRGVFGATSPAAAAKQSLNITLDLSEAYDDDVLGEGAPTSTALSGLYSMLRIGGDYSRPGRKVRVGINFSTSLRYYTDLKSVRNNTSSLGAGFSASLPHATTWTVNQTVAYSPSYLYALFPTAPSGDPGELPAAAAPEYAVNDQESFSYNTATSLSHRLTARGSFTIGGTLTTTAFVRPLPGVEETQSYSGHAEFSRGVGRSTSARIGYRVQAGDSGFGIRSPTVEHIVEFGVLAARPLSATRRATLEFRIGPSTVRVPGESIAAGGDALLGVRRLYRVAATAAALYQFGRTWQARASYDRGLEYLPGVQTPVLTGGVSATVGGSLGRRLELTTAAGYSSGESALRRLSTYRTYTGDVTLRYGVSRHIAAYAKYLYYFYNFRGVAPIVPGYPSRMERNGARVGLLFWLPVMKR